jgi:signal transduction histidine kinase
MPDDLAARLRDGAADAGAEFASGGADGHQLAVRTPWPDGPCAFVLVRRVDPAPGEFSAFALWSAAAIAGAMVAVVALAAGTVVRRIRRLTDDVRKSAAARYETPVDERGSDEIADLARAFNAAGGEVRGQLAELARREETLRTFLANTTHDVMTPLTVLQGHLSAIRRSAAEGRAVDAEAANAAAEEAHYLASLVHNLSAVAKLDAGLRQVQLSPVNVNDLVQRVVERHWPLASPRAVDIQFAVPESVVWFDADLTLLEQAVSNVVGNAVRYNRPGGHVAVLLEEPSRTEFSIRVVDDGPGVSDEQLALLGRREYRTDDARRRHPEGTGLGLDIARRVAEFHRLRLEFRRSEHGGLEVEFRGARAPSPRSHTA